MVIYNHTKKKLKSSTPFSKKALKVLTQDLKYRTLQEQLVHLDSFQNLKNGLFHYITEETVKKTTGLLLERQQSTC